MPELAEVEFYRKCWSPGIGQRIHAVRLHREARIFCECDTEEIAETLTGSTLLDSEARGKQMVFRFSGGGWLGIHLGMTGKLACAPLPYATDKHEHLALELADQVLVFRDPRLFGRVRFARSEETPAWRKELPPEVLSDAFTLEALAAFLQRRKRSPLKAVLLMQDRFPGIGNWMADEILWRVSLAPTALAGSLTPAQVEALYCCLRDVCRQAMEVIGTDWGTPPDDWLFNHRWKAGGDCPRCGEALAREQVGGRTSCYCPVCQPG